MRKRQEILQRIHREREGTLRTGEGCKTTKKKRMQISGGKRGVVDIEDTNKYVKLEIEFEIPELLSSLMTKQGRLVKFAVLVLTLLSHLSYSYGCHSSSHLGFCLLAVWPKRKKLRVWQDGFSLQTSRQLNWLLWQWGDAQCVTMFLSPHSPKLSELGLCKQLWFSVLVVSMNIYVTLGFSVSI